ncbi:SagB/ThcOx family dehydrogenase [Prosthecochloris sp. SCSIO W1103]|uniref:SagB/ThcOx family dehydrogenase n=1 Tax=Prosthecochloris sp. SCSIO W1103 TaxID=2992244 RepID=UPI00223CC595|nr:SagB/ThcOx family dehydrogenase [Prosthecochloris sp. SCSIO W1103]UZJ37620.1 SagB/ThcOx family dehydrogenase [Prosthecochloris sp. SCSIO W1103]
MQAGRKPHEKLEDYRYFLKDSIRQEINFTQTAQSRRLPAPPLQKPSHGDTVRIDLPEGPRSLRHCCRAPVGEAIMERESVRFYSDEALTLEELSALLWATQGVRHVLSEECALRTVPSAGARHSFETYIAVSHVEELPAGLYRYLPFDHQLLQLFLDEKIGDKASWACMAQRFVAGAAVTFFWTTIPARTEWRYDLAAHKVIALDAGHVCQNLYLACTALGAGTCAIAAYDQAECDRLLGVDGEDEFTVYIAPVGKV